MEDRSGGAGCSKDEEKVCKVCKKLDSDWMEANALDEENWAQCDLCDEWVHLEGCCGLQLSDIDYDEALFVCPMCDKGHENSSAQSTESWSFWDIVPDSLVEKEQGTFLFEKYFSYSSALCLFFVKI